jgi:hypothetical protein
MHDSVYKYAITSLAQQTEKHTNLRQKSDVLLMLIKVFIKIVVPL